jgi:hypothetical protein
VQGNSRKNTADVVLNRIVHDAHMVELRKNLRERTLTDKKDGNNELK